MYPEDLKQLVEAAEKEANRRLALDGIVTLCDFFDILFKEDNNDQD